MYKEEANSRDEYPHAPAVHFRLHFVKVRFHQSKEELSNINSQTGEETGANKSSNHPNHYENLGFVVWQDPPKETLLCQGLHPLPFLLFLFLVHVVLLHFPSLFLF